MSATDSESAGISDSGGETQPELKDQARDFCQQLADDVAGGMWEIVTRAIQR